MPPVPHRVVYLSLFAAFLLALIPWSGAGAWLRPDFVLLVLLYWLLRAPQVCNIGTAWILGALVDVAHGSLLGQNALAYCATGFVALLWQRQLVLFSAPQQSAFVFFLLLLHPLLLLIIKLLSGAVPPGWHIFLPAVSGILLWHTLLHLGLPGLPHKKVVE